MRSVELARILSEAYDLVASIILQGKDRDSPSSSNCSGACISTEEHSPRIDLLRARGVGGNRSDVQDVAL